MLRLLERTCWVVGSLLLALYALARADGAAGREVALARFDAARTAAAAPPEPGTAGAESLPERFAVDVTLWNPKRIELYEQSFAEELETPLAILEIPRFDLRVPVLDGMDELRLNRGVGRIPGTARPGEVGNLAIAGHRDGFFRRLEQIAAGDEVRIVTLDGQQTYLVESIAIVGPDDAHVLDPTPTPVVTLVTCYPFYWVGHAPQRYIVRAHLKEVTGGGTDVIPAVGSKPTG